MEQGTDLGCRQLADSTTSEMQAHQLTGVWREWQYQYDPEDSHSRSAFLTANLARSSLARTAILERALRRRKEEAEAARSATDLESGEHHMAAAEGQGVPVTQVDAAEPVPDVDFTDLFTGPGCRIPLTEERAISLDQLDLVMAHVTRRLTGGETWKATRFENGKMVEKGLTDPAAAQLYDVSTHAIVPSTAALELSLVEAMATTPQIPHFFISHS